MNQRKFQSIVNQFKTRKDKKGNLLKMHYLLIKQDENIYRHSFNDRQEPSDIRSISKTVLTLVAGILKDLSAQGKYPDFDENTYVFPILKDVVTLTNLANENQLNKIQVKHLLNHTVGYDQVLLMRGDIVNMDPFTYLDYVVNAPIKYEPGEYYLYSNAGFYLLSAVLQEFIEEDLLDFISRHLFEPLGITNYRWDKYGNYLAGATRLKMFPEDLVKIGETIMNKGTYKNKSIVSSQWIEKMLRPTSYTSDIDNPNAIFRRHAYGNGIWLAKEDLFFGHGTDGQILAMIPAQNTIIVTLAHQHDITEIESIVNDVVVDICP